MSFSAMWKGTDVTMVLGRARSRARSSERALVVERLLPPVVEHELGEDDGEEVVGVLLVELVDEPQDRPRQLAVGRVHGAQLDRDVVVLPLAR